MTTFNSLILAGFSGVGKDTMFGLLTKDYPNLYNVKFSSLTKDVLAATFRVPRPYMDGFDSEPKWRNSKLYANGKLTEVTPLLLLSTLFHGSQKTELGKLNVEYALGNIPSDVFPVFTDVRREYEYQAIVNAGWNPLFVYLERDGIEEGVSDEDVISLAADYDDIRIHLDSGNVKTDYERLKALIVPKLKLVSRKPTLNIYYGFPAHNIITAKGLPNYEPVSILLDRCYESLKLVFNLPEDVIAKRTVDLLQAVINEADISKLQLTPVTQDCWMKADYTHLKLFPRLREQANLKFYLQSGNSTSVWYNLTEKEKANVQFI